MAKLQEAIQVYGKPTNARVAELRAQDEQIRAQSQGPAILQVVDSIAQIEVKGILTKNPDFFLRFFGFENTAFSDIIESIKVVASDERVQSVKFLIDSPGGSVDGLFETVSMIESLRGIKATSVLADNAMSAAFDVASVAGPIEARHAAAMFGSVGVVQQFFLFDDEMEITNSESPDKRPDPRTEEGKATIVRFLDAVFDQFVQSIARGRGVPESVVRSEFGRGAVFLANEAQRRGMIDTIAQPQLRVVSQSVASKISTTSKDNGMDLATLRRDHPQVFEEAKEIGAAEERDRVMAHLKAGEQSGAIPIAITAIENGDLLTQKYQAEYMAAAWNKQDRTSRRQDDDETQRAVGNAGAPVEEDVNERGRKVADAVVAALGG